MINVGCGIMPEFLMYQGIFRRGKLHGMPVWWRIDDGS